MRKQRRWPPHTATEDKREQMRTQLYWTPTPEGFDLLEEIIPPKSGISIPALVLHDEDDDQDEGVTIDLISIAMGMLYGEDDPQLATAPSDEQRRRSIEKIASELSPNPTDVVCSELCGKVRDEVGYGPSIRMLKKAAVLFPEGGMIATDLIFSIGNHFQEVTDPQERQELAIAGSRKFFEWLDLDWQKYEPDPALIDAVFYYGVWFLLGFEKENLVKIVIDRAPGFFRQTADGSHPPVVTLLKERGLSELLPSD